MSEKLAQLKKKGGGGTDTSITYNLGAFSSPARFDFDKDASYGYITISGGRINVLNTFSIQEAVGCTATILSQGSDSGTWNSSCVVQLTDIQSGGHVIVRWTPSKADSGIYGVKSLVY